MKKDFNQYDDMKHRIDRAIKERRDEATLSIFYPVKRSRKGLFGPLADRLFGEEIVFVPADRATREALLILEHDGYHIKYKRVSGAVYCRAIATQLSTTPCRKSAA